MCFSKVETLLICFCNLFDQSIDTRNQKSTQIYLFAEMRIPNLGFKPQFVTVLRKNNLHENIIML